MCYSTDMHKEIPPFLQYLLGGLVLSVLVGIYYYLQSSNIISLYGITNIYDKYFYCLLVAIPFILFSLSRLSRQLALGFMAGILAFLMFWTILFVEFIIHPPEEE